MGRGKDCHTVMLMWRLLGGLDEALSFSTSPVGRQLDDDNDALYSVFAALIAGAQHLSKSSKKSARLLVHHVALTVAEALHPLLSVALSSDYHIEPRELALEFFLVPTPPPPPPPAASRRPVPPPTATRPSRRAGGVQVH